MPGTCTILMYHIIDHARDQRERRLCCSPELFRQQMSYLASSGRRVITFGEFVGYVVDGRELSDDCVVITFDDGIACAHRNALPVLQEFKLPATLFAISGLLGGRNQWMTQAGLPERRMLSIPELRELRSCGIEIGSHTVTHMKMAGRPKADLCREANHSKTMLEDYLGERIDSFAYPYGSFDDNAVDSVRSAGYVGACTTVMGLNRSGSASPYLLHRTEIRGDESPWQFALKLRIGTHDMPPWSLMRRFVKGLLPGARRPTAN